MRWISLAIPVLAVMGSLPTGAEMFGSAFQRSEKGCCWRQQAAYASMADNVLGSQWLATIGKESSTLCCVACVQAKIDAADHRLYAAYKAPQARIDANQCQPRLTAPRLWVQYRDAHCAFRYRPVIYRANLVEQ